MPESNEFHVIIIGGGLVGPALALALKKRHGIRSSLYEIRPEDYNPGTNIALAPNALRVLSHIGVYDQLLPHGFCYESVVVSSGRGERLASYLAGSEKEYNFPAFRVNRSKVRSVLLAELNAQDIPIHYDMKFSSIDEEAADSVTVNFEGGISVKANFVIGADGVHSKVRRHLFPSSVAKYPNLFGVTGLLPRNQLHKSAAATPLPGMWYGQHGFIAVMPSSMDGEDIGFFSTLSGPDRPRNEWEALDTKKDEIRQMLIERHCDGAWPELISNICKSAPGEMLNIWPFYVVPTLSRWRSSNSRVIVIGDAAHGITPTGGIGAAVGLEDADSLAYVLSKIKQGCDLNSLLYTWELHRIQRVAQVVQYTAESTKLRRPGESFIRQWIKEWVLWAKLKYTGPQAGREWLYQYNAEDIVGILKSAGL
ncbi:hypothetical protein OIDMADRAFT_136925 [Oidiodendron maius Zn]|uniref:FAD-binding domain-containing protein n=1 Tax=Oidiodendron maius (strain Zn) TaxID=913774 RepID=A0A0C3GU25_OIDMZ|nr:hypothetical protein OIDMADRAFT_136925 [Oidiodendron maius Zn]